MIESDESRSVLSGVRIARRGIAMVDGSVNSLADPRGRPNRFREQVSIFCEERGRTRVSQRVFEQGRNIRFQSDPVLSHSGMYKREPKDTQEK